MMSTEINLDPSETWKYLSPDARPANVPTTGEDNTVIAPWLAPDEPVCLQRAKLVSSFINVSLPSTRTTALAAPEDDHVEIPGLQQQAFVCYLWFLTTSVSFDNYREYSWARKRHDESGGGQHLHSE